MTESFGIGVLAERTGLTPGQLRTWETRFGFPRGQRADNGRRRFTAADVARVQRVLVARAEGLPLAVAIDQVRSSDGSGARPSVYGALASQFAGVRSERLSRASMVRVSRALEDECLAQPDGEIVLGAFQRREHFEESRDRWDELARTASWCAVVADFGRRPQPRKAGPVLGHLAADAPMRREWTVVTLGAAHGAVLSGWEVPGSDNREFEAVLSVRPALAQAAARVLTGILAEAGVAVPDHVTRRVTSPPAPGDPTATDRLLGRAVGYLAASGGR